MKKTPFVHQKYKKIKKMKKRGCNIGKSVIYYDMVEV